jgi:phosphoribosylaminoimidazole-succinocarboxamide synthase
LNRDEIAVYLDRTFSGISETAVPAGMDFRRGKVRDILDAGNEMVIVTTDRISAFDRVLTTIPCKGEVLNRISLHWFERTEDIVANHVVAQLSPRTVRVRKGSVLPVEVVVRGYLTGSAWRDYQAKKDISGITLPAGMRLNERFDEPIVTPSTKEEHGGHDRPISGAQIVEQRIVDSDVWRSIEETAKALFARGSALLAERGLILVDTKYEFGLVDGELTLIDEIHTPDSSRFWFADTYDELFRAGKPQRKIDKEYLRQWLMDRGFMGDGEVPEIPDQERVEVAWRYIQAYQLVTGEDFQVQQPEPKAEERLIQSL